MFRRINVLFFSLPLLLISCISWSFSLPDEKSVTKIKQDNYEYWLLPSPKQEIENTSVKDIAYTQLAAIKKIHSPTSGHHSTYIAISRTGKTQAVAYNVQTQQYVPVSGTIRVEVKQFNELSNIIRDYNLTLVSSFKPRLLAFLSISNNSDLADTFSKLKEDQRIKRAWLSFKSSVAITD